MKQSSNMLISIYGIYVICTYFVIILLKACMLSAVVYLFLLFITISIYSEKIK